jgi:hypothetical protein
MATERRPETPWSVLVRLEDVPETGRHVDLAASESERAAVAQVAGLDGIDRLEATFDLVRRGSDGLHAAGRVSATVRQTCVVSLEPIVNTIDEPIDLNFAPSREPVVAEADSEDDDDEGPVRSRKAAEDAPEPLVNGAADLGAVATEFLMLGVDPYPRKPGVRFEAPRSGEDAAGPFAALEALKKGKGDNSP